MARLTTIANLIAGIGLAVLAFAAILHYLLLGITDLAWVGISTWTVAAGLLVLVLIFAVVNTFTEVTGFVHPEDKLVANMFVFIMAIATILIYGIFPGVVVTQDSLFRTASMIVIAYVFLFVFTYFSSTITEGADMSQVKEMTARFMLVSLLLGAIMAGLMLLLDWIMVTLSYEWASVSLGAFAVVLVFIMAFALGRKYEPVGE
ncbi:MAG: hypothetical protein KAW94_03910 [Candidatus Thorarchaeota archaeon]|nr:hypothetical protein [Candidatus Thorarchaeota archaeon]